METAEFKSRDADGDDGYSKSFDSEEAEKSLLWNESRRASFKKKTSFYLHISVTAINIVLFIISASMLWLSFRRNSVSLQDHWKATSFYSPVLDRYNIPTKTVTTNGTLFDTNPPSIWRIPYGSKADDAWDEIGGTIGPIGVTADEIRALGKDPSLSVKLPESYGKGDNTYLASVEVFHHIHCLDKLRREISYSHYWDKEEGPPPGKAMHAAHTAHCVDVLLQSLMCTGSVDMITWNWVEGRDMMMPDFENKKVCRDFDGILEWTKKSGLGLEEADLLSLKPPKDAKRVPNMMHDAR